MFVHRPAEGAGRAPPHFARLHSAWYLPTGVGEGEASATRNPFLTPEQLNESASATAKLYQRGQDRAASKLQSFAAAPPQMARPFGSYPEEPPVGRRPARPPTFS